MPDADKIGTFSRHWSKMYKKVCEGHFDNASLADDAMISLRKDIENYGHTPVFFLKEASARLESIQNNPLFLPVHNWEDEDDYICDLRRVYSQRYKPNPRGINMAISAYKDLVHELRNKGNILGSLQEALISRYIHQVYDGNFVDLALIELENHADVDQDGIHQRLNEMSIFIDELIDLHASQIVRKGRVKRLRSSSRPARLKTVSIEDDVFSLGNSK
jgi:hypothetical protein